jgi:hypothetical protein
MALLKLRKIIMFLTVLLGIIGYGLGQQSSNFSNSVVLNSKVPIPEHGLIVPFKTKGYVVYITVEQRQYIDFLGWIQVFYAAFGLLMFLLMKWYWEKCKTDK